MTHEVIRVDVAPRLAHRAMVMVVMMVPTSRLVDRRGNVQRIVELVQKLYGAAQKTERGVVAAAEPRACRRRELAQSLRRWGR